MNFGEHLGNTEVEVISEPEVLDSMQQTPEMKDNNLFRHEAPHFFSFGFPPCLSATLWFCCPSLTWSLTHLFYVVLDKGGGRSTEMHFTFLQGKHDRRSGTHTVQDIKKFLSNISDYLAPWSCAH